MGLSLASCHKDEIWDLRAELGLIWDHFRASVPIGTKSQIWDLITSTVLVIWIFFFSENKFSGTEAETFFRDQIFPKPKPRLFFRTKFSETETETFFIDQIFWNRNRYFFFMTKFLETETFFPRPNFPKPKPSKNWQKFRNREVSKPKCQSLLAYTHMKHPGKLYAIRLQSDII